MRPAGHTPATAFNFACAVQQDAPGCIAVAEPSVENSQPGGLTTKSIHVSHKLKCIESSIEEKGSSFTAYAALGPSCCDSFGSAIVQPLYVICKAHAATQRRNPNTARVGENPSRRPHGSGARVLLKFESSHV